MLFNCPDCGEEVDDNLTKCPHCGFLISGFIAWQEKKILNKSR